MLESFESINKINNFNISSYQNINESNGWNGILYDYYREKKNDVIFWGEEDKNFPVSDFSSFLLGVPILSTTVENEKTVRVHAQMTLNLPIEYELSMETSFDKSDEKKILENGDLSKETIELISQKYRNIEKETKDMTRVKVASEQINEKYRIKTNNEPFTNIILCDDYLTGALDDNYIFSLSVLPVESNELDTCDLHKIDVYVRDNYKNNTIIDKEDIDEMVELCRKIYLVMFPYILNRESINA